MAFLAIPEALELGEVAAPFAERLGAKALGMVTKKVGKKTMSRVANGAMLAATFSHHQDPAIHDHISNHVQTFKNNYSDHPTKISVDHDASTLQGHHF